MAVVCPGKTRQLPRQRIGFIGDVDHDLIDFRISCIHQLPVAQMQKQKDDHTVRHGRYHDPDADLPVGQIVEQNRKKHACHAGKPFIPELLFAVFHCVRCHRSDQNQQDIHGEFLDGSTAQKTEQAAEKESAAQGKLDIPHTEHQNGR